MLKSKVLRLCFDALCISWPFLRSTKNKYISIVAEWQWVRLFRRSICCPSPTPSCRSGQNAFWEFISHLDTLFHFTFLGPSAKDSELKTSKNKNCFHSLRRNEFPCVQIYPYNMRVLRSAWFIFSPLHWRQFHIYISWSFSPTLHGNSISKQIQNLETWTCPSALFPLWIWRDRGFGTF